MAVKKVKGFDNLMKDTDGGGVSNTNMSEYDAAVKAKKRVLAQMKEAEDRKAYVAALEDRIAKLETLVNSLVKKNGSSTK